MKPTSLRRKGALVTAAVVLALSAVVLSACSGADSDSGASSTGISGAALDAVKATVAAAETEPTTPSPTEPPAFTPKAGGKLYFVACDLAVVGCSTFASGVQAASDAIGYELTVCDGGNQSPQMEQCFTNAVNAVPDVIISGVPEQFAGKGYAAANAAGIPIIGLFTSNPPGSTKAEVAYSTCTEQGKLDANVVIAGGEGNPNTLLVTQLDVACTVARTDGFTTEYKKLCPDCALTQIEFEAATMQQSLPQQIQAALVQNPDIDWIQAIFDGPASIAVTQVHQAGKQDDVSVVGMDGNAPNIQLIRDDDVQKYDLALAQEEDSWQAVDAAARVFSGQPVEYDIPVNTYLVSANNVDTLPPSNVWPGTPDYPGYFKKLWNMG